MAICEMPLHVREKEAENVGVCKTDHLVVLKNLGHYIV